MSVWDDCARSTLESVSCGLLRWEILGVGTALVIGRIGWRLCEEFYRGEECCDGCDCDEHCCMRASVGIVG